jgi:hypothetical protein
MSLALIEESAKEVRRLAIAGSPLAVGDFRIKKLIAPLEQAGAKVPVFAQVAKSISELANGTEAESATRLLALSTLLNAILYTQGQTGTSAPFAELEVFATNCTGTRTTARALKPLIAALTNSGAGRLEIIKSACERGAFNDLRLTDAAIQALGDNYPEIADLVAEKILPAYGPGIVPRLKLGLDLKGKKSDARRLIVMHRVDPAGALGMCKAALEDGSAEVKAAAVECLGQHEEFLPLVMEQANAKNKIVRAAALEVLAAHDRPEIVKLFDGFIKTSAFDLLARPFRAIRNRQLINSLLGEGKRVFELIVKGDEEQLARYSEILGCLGQRKDAEIESFLLDCFNQTEWLVKIKAAKNSTVAGPDLAFSLASLLYNIGSQKALEAILAKRNDLPLPAFNFVLASALRIWPPDKCYQEFSPVLAQTNAVGKDKCDMLRKVVLSTTQDKSNAHLNYYYDADCIAEPDLKAVQWDPRWLEAAIKADQLAIVCCLARPGHKGTISYLLALLDAGAKKTVPLVARVMGRSGLIIQTLAHCQYPDLTEMFLKTIASRLSGAPHVDYDLQLLFSSARYLPAADLPKLDAFAAKLDEKFVDKYLEALEPLRAATQKNQN